ncbi:hypothetical protein WJX73_005820 [Symbiochloris irregularis]|uniref:Maltase n=1 Tax=Symbiochloris irregularis TaxID=706552 RepID=A0AAW1NLZ0_9CHLO
MPRNSATVAFTLSRQVWIASACVALLSGALAQSSGNGTCDNLGPRVFCAYNGVTEDKCTGQYGCCYDTNVPTTVGNAGAPVSIPVCFYKNGGGSTYSLSANTSAGGQGGKLTSTSGTMSKLGPDITNLDLTVSQLSPTILRVTIGAPGRWTVPQSTIFKGTGIDSGASSSNALNFTSTSNPFSFTVTRAGTTEPLFDTTGQRLVFKDQYIEFASTLPSSSAVFGLGERTPSYGMQLLRNALVPLALWNRDNPAADPDENIYGSHPNYMEIREDGTAHGVVLMNCNGMDVVLADDTIQFRVVGGVIDLYFLSGPTPNLVSDQLTQIIGRPVMPPYWAMGLMQSKFGYESADYYSYVVDNYAAAGIPLDTFVADSQYMNNQQDFTLGAAFPQSQVAAFIDTLHSNGQHFVPIIDPFIHISQSYSTYTSGVTAAAFLNDVAGTLYIGQGWPGATVYPDFDSTQGVTWWQGQMQNFHQLVNYDGVWLDMNEISNYCTGDVCENPGSSVGVQLRFICQVPCQSGVQTATNGSDGARNTNASSIPAAGYFSPPYAINNGNSQLPLSTKTLATTVTHHNGELEYNLHNLYGIQENIATYNELINLRGKRPFILTRATWLGSGAYAAHWTGDTLSAEQDMVWTIPSVMNAGLAGITFAGADICGFSGYASENLCARWAAIGAWYPFSRNHHADGFQEFYRWPNVAIVARKVFGWRYRAMPYLYTAFYQSHTNGCPVMRPLFFTFPNDQTTWDVNSQFMIGDGLMVAPCLQENGTSVEAYFPQGMWYSLYDGTATDASTRPQNVSLEVGITDDVPLYLLGGSNGSVTACGRMYLDGGEELSTGNALDNYITLNAVISTTSSSHLDVFGVGPVDTSSVTLQTLSGSAATTGADEDQLADQRNTCCHDSWIGNKHATRVNYCGFGSL